MTIDFETIDNNYNIYDEVTVEEIESIDNVCSVYFENITFDEGTAKATADLMRKNLISSASFIEVDFEGTLTERYLFTTFEKTSIKELYINSTTFCAHTLLKLIDACSDTLESFGMIDCNLTSYIDSSHLANYLLKCSNLNTIIIRHNDVIHSNNVCDIINADTMFSIFMRNRDFCNNLEKVHFSLGNYLSDITLNFISTIIADKDSKLSEIYIYYCSITDIGLSNLVDAILLKDKNTGFHIKDNNFISEECVSIVERLLDNDDDIDDIVMMDTIDSTNGLKHNSIMYIVNNDDI